MLRKDSAGWFAFLRLIPPGDDCRAVFSPEVPPEMLDHIAVAFTQHAAVESVAWCARWLGGLSRVGRLEMTVLMLDTKVLARLRAMFEALEALSVEAAKGGGLSADDKAPLDALPKLRATFGVA